MSLLLLLERLVLTAYTLPTLSGIIGTVQLVFFRQFWCARFTDIQLMLGALLLFAAAQLLVINWGPVSGVSFPLFERVEYMLHALVVVWLCSVFVLVSARKFLFHL